LKGTRNDGMQDIGTEIASGGGSWKGLRNDGGDGSDTEIASGEIQVRDLATTGRGNLATTGGW